MTILDPASLLGTDPGRKLLSDGTFRTVPPEETLARVRPHLAGMGITRVGTLTGLDRIGIPVVMACRPNARSLAVSQGKGLTLAAAQASGTMESIELHHAEHIDRPLRLGSAGELSRQARLLDLDRVARVGLENPSLERRALWIEGLDMMSGEMLWLPYELVHTDYRLPLPPGLGSLITTSNGLASGNHRLEAVCHGLCEVIERDAKCLWDSGGALRRRSSRLNLESVENPDCRGVVARLRETGFEVAVWDMTSDLAVPAFTCLIVDREREGAHGGTGDGCHPRPEVALMRALLEAVQVRTTYISGARDDLNHVEFQAATIADRRQRALRLIGDAPPVRDFDGAAGWSVETFAEDVETILDRLRSAGLDQAAVVDLSRPDFESADWSLSVVRVVVPGLEGPHDEPDYFAGRRARAAMDGDSV